MSLKELGSLYNVLFFWLKVTVCLGTLQKTFAKLHPLIFPIFRQAELPSLKVYKKILGRLFNL